MARGSKPFCSVMTAVAILVCAATTARAQGVGFQGGAGLDPSQGYVGTHVELPLASHVSLRPGVDGSFGSGVQLAIIDITFLYEFPLGTMSPWTVFQGTGPVVTLERADNQVHAHGGIGGVFGFAHTNGFFFEFKVGGGGGPNLRLGVGHTFRHRKP